MKKVILMTISVLIFGIVFVSCDNSEFVGGVKLEDGIYTGTFTVKYSVEMPESWGRGSGITTLELRNGKFTSTGNPNRIPAGGSGNFSVHNGKIVFEDVNGWTADFDWNLILKGEYDYKFDGKRLKFSANKNDVGYYEYDLIKQ
jgi:hypothetical protein